MKFFFFISLLFTKLIAQNPVDPAINRVLYIYEIDDISFINQKIVVKNDDRIEFYFRHKHDDNSNEIKNFTIDFDDFSILSESILNLPLEYEFDNLSIIKTNEFCYLFKKYDAEILKLKKNYYGNIDKVKYSFDKYLVGLNDLFEVIFNNNKIYLINDGYNLDGNSNFEVYELINDRLNLIYSFKKFLGDEYKNFIHKNIDIYKDNMAILPLAGNQFYILGNGFIDTIKFQYKDDKGFKVDKYDLPSSEEKLKCDKADFEMKEILLNKRYRNEKIFFVDSNTVLISYLVPGYLKDKRNILIFKRSIVNGVWSLVDEIIALKQIDFDGKLSCLSKQKLNITTSQNVIFNQNKAYQFTYASSDKSDCIVIDNQENLSRMFKEKKISSVLIEFDLKFNNK